LDKLRQEGRKKVPPRRGGEEHLQTRAMAFTCRTGTSHFVEKALQDHLETVKKEGFAGQGRGEERRIGGIGTKPLDK